MARTAPVPNIPAPPGMNPGTWIMGGGGAGGGGGPGSGKGKNGAGGAGGPNDGQGGPGDGNGAGSCGQGGAGACTNCSSKTSAGDPIDVVTGEVFTGWKTDLYLPGFFHLDVRRKYTTAARGRDVGFGHGWIHSLAWEIHEETRGLVLTTGGGFRTECDPLPHVGDQAFRKGWAILRTAEGFLLRAGDEFIHSFERDEAEPHVYRLSSIRYRQRGTVRLTYDQGRLTTVIDTAGRTILFERGHDGRIARLLVPEPNGPTTVFARYAYSDAGDLVQITDGDGFVTSHAYDLDHRLIRTTHPTGLTFHFAYDERGRGVETWGDYPGHGREAEASTPEGSANANANANGADPALADDVPAFLADGTTVAKGIHHVRLTFFDDGTSEVVDSVRFHRFFGSSDHPGTIVKALDSKGGVTVRTLDDDGNETSHEDPIGAVWTWTYDLHGGVVRETDPEGHTILLERDRESRIVRIVDAAGGAVSVGRDAAGEVEWVQDQRGGTTFQRRDARGQVVEWVDRRGGAVRITYDASGNVLSEVDPRGATTSYQHDYLGRRTGITVPRGGTESYRYSPMGKLLERRDLLGRRLSFRYDGMGELVGHTRADGQAVQLLRGGNSWIYAQIMPSGERLDWRYNREGWVSFVQNEKGERHRFAYDADGLLLEERGFDDSARTYKRDARGRIIAVTDVDRGTLEITRNLLGLPTTETTAEGESVQYDYDLHGRLVRAAGPHTCVSWLRDAAGDVVEERCDVDGATYRIESVLDPEGRKRAYRTSLGHMAEIRRDDAGAVQEIWTDGKPCVAIARDVQGAPTRTSLSQGGVLRELWDDADRLVELRVERPGLPPAREAPAWVGGDGNISTAWRYRYDALSEVSAVESTRDGVIEYQYDLRRRLRSATRNGETVESYFGDAAGNTVPRGNPSGDPGRGAPVVEKGNRLVWSDRFAYTFDAAGFLREKRDATSGAVTRYTYDGHDLLSRVELPSGEIVSFLYDHAARRVQKLVAKRQADDSELPLRTTHFVWDGAVLRHSLTFQADGTTSRRTYLSEDDDVVTPLGHYDGDPADAALRYYVTRLTGMPEQIVDGAGNVVGSLSHDSYGRLLDRQGETTEARAAGQWEDQETGLFYNRYRYFDPAIGRYISPDPIGISGGENLYAYGPNPLAWVDPLGWAGHRITVLASGTSDGVMDRLRGAAAAKTPRVQTNPLNPADIDVNSGGPCVCSERNLIDQLQGVDLSGQKITMKGEYPPCPACDLAMTKLAKGSDGITYSYTGADGKTQNTVTYHGDGRPPTRVGDEGLGDLHGAYKLNEDGTGHADPETAQKEYERQRDAVEPTKAKNRQDQADAVKAKNKADREAEKQKQRDAQKAHDAKKK